jgi:hypothetical protein
MTRKRDVWLASVPVLAAALAGVAAWNPAPALRAEAPLPAPAAKVALTFDDLPVHGALPPGLPGATSHAPSSTRSPRTRHRPPTAS